MPGGGRGVRRAALLAVGDELLGGQQIDTNSAWLSARLVHLGWQVQSFSVLGDDEQAIAKRLVELATGVELLVLTGGLGPTLDDLTRHAVARAAQRELELDLDVVEGIRALFASRQREMAPANERQGLFPRGAVPLGNKVGTAPGFRLQHDSGCWIVAFPGPPRELQPMFMEEFEPWLRNSFPSSQRTRVANFYLFGIPESDFAREVGDWMDRDAQPCMGVCASGSVLKVRIDGTGPESDESCRLFARRVDDFRERFTDAIFSETDPGTTVALAQLLLRRGLTIACAESCTGGEIASRLTAIPGISKVFLEGFVTYSNEAKTARLGVSAELLERYGAVSSEVAAEMASGAARASGARLALSTTGIAGPGGGSPEKPVGLVHVGVCIDGIVSTKELRLPSRGRDLIRDWAATSACELARRALIEHLGAADAEGC